MPDDKKAPVLVMVSKRITEMLDAIFRPGTPGVVVVSEGESTHRITLQRRAPFFSAQHARCDRVLGLLALGYPVVDEEFGLITKVPEWQARLTQQSYLFWRDPVLGYAPWGVDNEIDGRRVIVEFDEDDDPTRCTDDYHQGALARECDDWVATLHRLVCLKREEHRSCRIRTKHTQGHWPQPVRLTSFAPDSSPPVTWQSGMIRPSILASVRAGPKPNLRSTPEGKSTAQPIPGASYGRSRRSRAG